MIGKIGDLDAASYPQARQGVEKDSQQPPKIVTDGLGFSELP
ncbi:hypothetical protein [Sterolibacterium denitrificans]|nr:hypothetical protein [Sterolibacterium denitrificans]